MHGVIFVETGDRLNVTKVMRLKGWVLGPRYPQERQTYEKAWFLGSDKALARWLTIR